VPSLVPARMYRQDCKAVSVGRETECALPIKSAGPSEGWINIIWPANGKEAAFYTLLGECVNTITVGLTMA
jgi:hypothetical protein